MAKFFDIASTSVLALDGILARGSSGLVTIALLSIVIPIQIISIGAARGVSLGLKNGLAELIERKLGRIGVKKDEP